MKLSSALKAGIPLFAASFVALAPMGAFAQTHFVPLREWLHKLHHGFVANRGARGPWP